MSKTLDALEQHAENERLRAAIREEEAKRDAERQAEDAATDAAVAAEEARTALLERDAVEATYPWNAPLTVRNTWQEEHPEAAWSVEEVLEHVSRKRGTISMEHLERLSESELLRFKDEHEELYRKSLEDRGPLGVVANRSGNVAIR
jgi:hypothetical protein